jgi:hypothetical protein
MSTMASRTRSHLVASRISLPIQTTLRNGSLTHFSIATKSSISSRENSSLLLRRGPLHRRTFLPRALYPQTMAFSSSTSQEKVEKVSSKVDTLVELAKNRRTYYQLGKNSPVPDSKVEELVQNAILHIPSSFNTQSARLIVLLREEHDKLWDIVISAFGELVKTGAIPEELWKNQTKPKLEGFKAAYGTVSCLQKSLQIMKWHTDKPCCK